MIKIDIDKLLFTKSFLDLKYKTKSREAMNNIHLKYSEGKLDFLDVDKNKDIYKIEEFVKNKKNLFDNVVVLGIGGSALGTKAIMQALKGKYYNELSREKRLGNPRLYILDNVDPSEVKNLIDIIDLKKTLFLVISKSGGTLETISQYTFFKNKIKENNLDIKKHFVIIAGENSNLKKNSLREGFEVFDIPEGIGGRFSAFTNVGLLPLAFIGVDIRRILKGVTNIKDNLLSGNIFENQALLTSIIQYHTYLELGKNITVFFPYASNLFYLGEWYKQMIGESLGKGGIGVTLTSAIGVTDQHSQLQLYYDGPNDKLLIFLEIEDFGVDYHICCDEKFTFQNLMHTEKYGTEKSISNYNKINYTIKIDKIDEETIGELILMLEMQVVILGEFYGFNVFKQPGVEIGKKITKEKLKENIGKIEILEGSTSKNITFIGGGNGQSGILKLFKTYTEKYSEISAINYNITSIVAMSDDGRTTGMLMRDFKEELGIHLPPPGDIRRILFTLSESKYKDFFSLIFEKVIVSDRSIESFNIIELFNNTIEEIVNEGRIVDLKKDLDEFLNKKGEIYDMIIGLNSDILNFSLPLKVSIKGHKFGNIIMANLYFNFEKKYSDMIFFLKKLFNVNSDILPITIESAYIKAILKNGDIIETQDKISNVADYDSAIKKIELLDSDIIPKITEKIKKAISNSDYIIIGPGDLYTSIIANFIIEGLTSEIEKSEAKIIYIINANNKLGETTGYKIVDFIDVVNSYLGRKNIDYILGNNTIPELDKKLQEKFKNDISVKGGKYLILDENEKSSLVVKYEKTRFISGKYINSKDLYKYNEKLIEDLVSILK